jgi:hypothetical protein
MLYVSKMARFRLLLAGKSAQWVQFLEKKSAGHKRQKRHSGTFIAAASAVTQTLQLYKEKHHAQAA